MGLSGLNEKTSRFRGYFQLGGAPKSVLKMGVSSSWYEHSRAPSVRAADNQVRTLTLGLGCCCSHFIKRARVPAASEAPVMATRRRLTPEYRRDVASLVLDTGSSIASAIHD